MLEAEPDDAVGGHCTDCNLKFDTRADLTEHYKVCTCTCTLYVVTIVVNFTLV